MPTLQVDVSQSLLDALYRQQELTGEPLEHIVSRALADALQIDHGTLFQVSTTGALVEGVSGDVVSVEALKEHGDFGLGTFTAFDGEMAAVDGQFFQMRGDGTVAVADNGAMVPFAVVTHFMADTHFSVAEFDDLSDLLAQLDRHRSTDNSFFAFRADGFFRSVHARVVNKLPVGVSLSEAAEGQVLFEFNDVKGTLIGFWSPAYARLVTVVGWHIHFLSDDRLRGGHLMACSGRDISCQLQHLNDFRIAIPETTAFLSASLRNDPSDAVEKAER